jgi:hypothetical protein
MIARRRFHTATLLLTGQVLLTGGDSGAGCCPNNAQNTAELYDPVGQTFAPTIGSMTIGRRGHSAALLSNGKVLILGGNQPNNSNLASAEVYDPVSKTFALVDSPMSALRVFVSAPLLSGGDVLIAGGSGDSTADRFSGTSFVPTGSMNAPRSSHTVTRLTSLSRTSSLFGFVLVTGGQSGPPVEVFATAELYNPTTGIFTPTALPMGAARSEHTATELFNGTVLLAGENTLVTSWDSAELYDPNTNTFSPAGTMTTPRVSHAAVLLQNGTVLIVGGFNNGPAASGVLSTAELYPAGFLKFPLNVACHGIPCTPFTAEIAAVMDHSGTPLDQSNPLPFWYQHGNKVKAYTGEIGDANFGVNCAPGPGYKNATNPDTDFLQNVVNYVGATCPKKTSLDPDANVHPRRFLNYDGHSGYDYPYPGFTPIVAAAAGTLFRFFRVWSGCTSDGSGL